MSNMLNWERLARPPKEALKQITGGRLKGMTDINPQWRYKAMTELFGQCGLGWKYEIVRLWTEPGQDGQVFAFAQVAVQVLRAESGGDPIPGIAWGEPIPGIGGSMLMEKDKYGLHHNDEAYKMAITDALSVAMKMLGVGADVYMGRWDGSKYRADSAQQNTIAPPPISGAAIKHEAYESMSAEEKQYIDDLAVEVVATLAERGREAALALIGEKIPMDGADDYDPNTFKNALAWRLDSKTRSALKGDKNAGR